MVVTREHQAFRTQPCKFFNHGLGTCSKGTDCVFSHIDANGNDFHDIIDVATSIWDSQVRTILDRAHVVRLWSRTIGVDFKSTLSRVLVTLNRLGGRKTH